MPENVVANEPGHGGWSRFLPHVVNLIVAAIVIWIVFSLNAALGQPGGGFLQSLREPEVARGLITLLVVVATVAMALVLVLAVIISNAEGLKERIALGREVLGTLVGIVGTIVGFYFGNATDRASSPGAAPTVQVAPVFLSSTTPKAGETVSISTFASAGKPPYTYSITFDPASIAPVKDAASPDGSIKYAAAIPSDLKPGTEVKFQITVRDAAGNTLVVNRDGRQKMVVAAP